MAQGAARFHPLALAASSGLVLFEAVGLLGGFPKMLGRSLL